MAAFGAFEEGAEGARQFLDTMGPGHVDASVRQSLQMLWMILPPEKKNVQDAEKEFRRIVDRALRDLQDDSESFGHRGG